MYFFHVAIIQKYSPEEMVGEKRELGYVGLSPDKLS
jgi:hypothetical protein